MLGRNRLVCGAPSMRWSGVTLASKLNNIRRYGALGHFPCRAIPYPGCRKWQPYRTCDRTHSSNHKVLKMHDLAAGEMSWTPAIAESSYSMLRGAFVE
jgi:hypothetical protein